MKHLECRVVPFWSQWLGAYSHLFRHGLQRFLVASSASRQFCNTFIKIDALNSSNWHGLLSAAVHSLKLLTSEDVVMTVPKHARVSPATPPPNKEALSKFKNETMWTCSVDTFSASSRTNNIKHCFYNQWVLGWGDSAVFFVGFFFGVKVCLSNWKLIDKPVDGSRHVCLENTCKQVYRV